MKAIVLSFTIFLTLKAQANLPDPVLLKKTLIEIQRVFTSLKSSFRIDQNVRENLLIRGQTLNDPKGKVYKTANGRELIYLHFQATNPRADTKTLLFIGGIHPDEYVPSLVSLKLLSDLLNNPNLIPDNHNIIFIPFLNMDGWIDGHLLNGYPTRKNANGVDLNRSFYDREALFNYQSEPETEFVLDLVEKFSPEYWIIPHSTLNILDLDGGKLPKYKAWLHDIHQATYGTNSGPIPIKSHGTYSPPNSKKGWSIGKLANELFKKGTSITSLTYEFGGPGEIPPANDPQRWLKISKRKHLGRYTDNTYIADNYYQDYFNSLITAINNMR